MDEKLADQQYATAVAIEQRNAAMNQVIEQATLLNRMTLKCAELQKQLDALAVADPPAAQE